MHDCSKDDLLLLVMGRKDRDDDGCDLEVKGVCDAPTLLFLFII
jgi:hypothetical protein